MEWLISNAIAALLLPPGSLLVAAAAGALLARRRPRVGRSLVAFSLLALYALAMPVASDALLASLEPPARDPLAGDGGLAIVVLGGGTYFSAPEYGGDTVGPSTLVRLRYAAHLHRASGTPILVTGGAPLGNASTEAELMARVLDSEFHVPVRWLEKASRNTLENARLTYSLLAPYGIRRIYLVTHAWHMPRAQLAFERSGFEVIPATTGYTTRHRTSALHFLPSASSLLNSSWFFHEVIGTGWYHLRIALDR
jgi:uncharacterized SAM-binding protein YcdF (DUF218 family)